MTILFLLAMVSLSLNMDTNETVKLPAIYIFGDSIFDVGTNSFLPNSSSRADMQFYGIDSPFQKPTGRFSNGYNAADRIGTFKIYTNICQKKKSTRIRISDKILRKIKSNL